MLHRVCCFASESVRFVPNQRNDHAVEVKEEHDQMKAELDKRFLHEVSIETMVLVIDS